MPAETAAAAVAGVKPPAAINVPTPRGSGTARIASTYIQSARGTREEHGSRRLWGGMRPGKISEMVEIKPTCQNTGVELAELGVGQWHREALET